MGHHEPLRADYILRFAIYTRQETFGILSDIGRIEAKVHRNILPNPWRRAIRWLVIPPGGLGAGIQMRVTDPRKDWVRQAR